MPAINLIHTGLVHHETGYGAEDCAICTERMAGPAECHKLTPCNHSFHPGCIIQWFRDGNATCPMCRQEHFVYRELYGRTRYGKLNSFERTAFRRYVKTPKASRVAVRAFERYLKAEAELKDHNKAVKTFRQVNKAILTENTRMRSKGWKYRDRMNKALNILHSIPVVPHVVRITRYDRPPRDRSAAPPPSESEAGPSSSVQLPEAPTLPPEMDPYVSENDEEPEDEEESEPESAIHLSGESDLSTSEEEDEEDDA